MFKEHIDSKRICFLINEPSRGSMKSFQIDPVLRLNDIVEILKVSRATVYRMIDDGKFPKGFLIASRARGWKKSEVEAWLANK